ncbi:unnamed protein product [Somion occarium]|uniref:Uncharacterized protein n=1 Tax=Somion occarium TaxID=3059160 RepID=A0ABP1CVB7_9APHY
MELWVPKYVSLVEWYNPLKVSGLLYPEALATQALEEYGLPRDVTIPEAKKMRREFEAHIKKGGMCKPVYTASNLNWRCRLEVSNTSRVPANDSWPMLENMASLYFANRHPRAI